MKNKKIVLVFISIAILSMLLYSKNVLASPFIKRIAGNDRYHTAVEVSKAVSDKSDWAIIANGENYPDALSAAPLAKKMNAPILLTGKNSLTDITKDRLTQLQVRNIYIIGGEGVVSKTVESEIASMGINTVRLAGQDRYETAIKVAEKLDSTGIFLTIGEDYSDALSVSAIAAEKGMLIILTQKDKLPGSVSDFISKKAGQMKVYIVGDSDVISNNVANQFKNAERITGNDKYQRNLNIINKFADEIDFNNIFVATGENFPDSLSGSVLAAKNNSAILLVNENSINGASSLLKTKNINQINILGGVGAVSDELINKLAQFVPDWSPEEIKTRVVVDGKVNTFDAKLFRGDWYLKPADIKSALGIVVTTTRDGYASLRDAARTANISYEHDGVLNAAYIWTDEPYADEASGDFNRAFSLGLVPDNLKTDTGRQITANEFRALLSAMVGKLEPGKVTLFEKNVTTYNKQLLRGEGFVMAYYAAVCVGADTWNNDFDNSKADGNDFWDTSVYEIDKLFPHIWDGPVKFSNSSYEWRDYLTAAFLWSFWHSSSYSGNQVFDYDEAAASMRPKEQLTIKEAVSAVVRVYDSYITPLQYPSLTDKKAVNYDKTIITDKLLNKANALPTITKENMPDWKGFVLSNGGSYESTDIVETGKDLRNIANWGFNSVRIMLTYQTLFDKNVQTVNLSNLKKLDALIAAAIKYNLHIDILTFSLPGRWTNTDFSTFKTIGSLDLFTNPDRQKEANAVWALLSERYKDIPGATLSFCPIWEAQNYDLSSGLPVEPYTSDDVAKVHGQLIDTIKKYSPDRFIIFEPTANNTSEQIIKESQKIKDTIQNKYPDALMMANFCEMPFVYAEMTAVKGENIDNNNHSMFKPAYPTTIYATQYHIDKGSSLDMNGELVAGTKIDIYLSKFDGAGSFKITADGKSLYNESFSTGNFNVGSPLSRYYPYAKSDKLISVTLPTDVKNLQVSYSGNWFEWSGIDVTLPARYAVKRWWFNSAYDSMLNGVEYTRPVLKDTSTIMLSPNSYDSGRMITINPDVTYTTTEIFAQSNKQTIEDWAKAMSKYSPNLIVRFENVGFNIGCIHDSALKYYDDLLSSFSKYGISWFSNDYWSMTHADFFYAGVKPVQYKGFSSFDADMLKLLQKYQQ